MHGLVAGDAPALDLAREKALIGLLVSAAAERLIESAHDCSDGGIAVTLAECAFDTDGIGCAIDIPGAAAHEDAWSALGTLFGESAGRVVVSVAPGKLDAIRRLASEKAVPFRVIGTTGGTRLRVAVAGVEVIDCSVGEAEQLWSSALSKYFEGWAA